MNKFLDETITQRLERTAKSLRKNNMQAFVVNTASEARAKTAELLHKGDTIGVGGSATLDECGILELIRRPEYKFIDRYESGLSREEARARQVMALSADAFITSSNAITEDGVLYNVDGNGNRVSAIAFGPSSVIVIAGYNKIVKSLDDAVKRVKSIAAPANTKRLSCQTYCQETGECLALAKCLDTMTSGCSSDARICCQYLVSAKQRNKDRIKVILVKEELGF